MDGQKNFLRFLIRFGARVTLYRFHSPAGFLAGGKPRARSCQRENARLHGFLALSEKASIRDGRTEKIRGLVRIPWIAESPSHQGRSCRGAERLSGAHRPLPPIPWGGADLYVGRHVSGSNRIQNRTPPETRRSKLIAVFRQHRTRSTGFFRREVKDRVLIWGAADQLDLCCSCN